MEVLGNQGTLYILLTFLGYPNLENFGDLRFPSDIPVVGNVFK